MSSGSSDPTASEDSERKEHQRQYKPGTAAGRETVRIKGTPGRPRWKEARSTEEVVLLFESEVAPLVLQGNLLLAGNSCDIHFQVPPLAGPGVGGGSETENILILEISP